MKKPLTMPDEPQPRNITRADLVMQPLFQKLAATRS
jgi:hypothetical protein